MSINVRWKCIVALSVLTLGAAACSDDISDDAANTEDPVVGDNNDGGGGGAANNNNNGGGDKDAGMGGGIEIPTDAGKPATMLDKGVVGKKCALDSDCGGTGGVCAQELTGGVFGQLFGGPGPTRGYCTAVCTTDAECGEGGLCFGYFPQFGPGECRRPCSMDSDCGRDDDYECATLTMPPLMVGNMSIPVPDTCQPKQPGIKFTNEVGIACTDDAMCNGGRCRTSDSFPGGYCTGVCYDSADCGTDGVCLLNVYGSGGDCFEGCAQDSDCSRDAQGYGCVPADETTKVCAAKADPLPDGVVGSACADDSTCGNGMCAARVGPEQVTTPGGYCSSLNCLEDAQCGAGGICSPTQGGTRCYKGCATNADCREAEGYTCTPRGDDQRLVCFPPITP